MSHKGNGRGLQVAILPFAYFVCPNFKRVSEVTLRFLFPRRILFRFRTVLGKTIAVVQCFHLPPYSLCSAVVPIKDFLAFNSCPSLFSSILSQSGLELKQSSRNLSNILFVVWLRLPLSLCSFWLQTTGGLVDSILHCCIQQSLTLCRIRDSTSRHVITDLDLIVLDSNVSFRIGLL